MKVDKLVKDYGAYRAVDGISFEIGRGQVLGLLGPNGAGKTTTIQMLVGITNLTSGRISYFGKNFASNRQASLQRINSTSAYNTLLGRISVRENMMTFAGLYQVENPKLKVAELLDRFEVSHLADNRYQELSAGERTRVNLAKSLLNDPELLLMDEPTASLDPDIADKTLSWIEQLRNDHKTAILFTSHNMAEVERICDDVIFMDRGKVVSRGTPAEHTARFEQVEIILTFKSGRMELEKLLAKRQLDFDIKDKNIVVIQSLKSDVAAVIAGLAAEKVDITDVKINQPDLAHVFIEIARSKQ